MNHIDELERRGRVPLFSTTLWVCAAAALGCGNGSQATDEGNGTEAAADAGDTGGTDTGSDTDVGLSECLREVDTSFSDADAADLFNADHVPIFDLFLPAAEWEHLQATAMQEEYTEAEACFDGRGIGTVGLRFKGSYGTLYECFDGNELICDRLSMKLKFDKYVEEQRFFGLKRLNFNANRYDDSRMKERLAYDVYRAMGIVAPRAAWAVVRVNGQSYGLYGMVEQVDGRFTADRWPDYPDGNLYKEAWPTDTDAIDLAGALRTNEDVGDVSGFATFSESIVTAAETDVLAALGGFTDLDYWARYMAVDEAILSYDGITYFWTDGVVFHNHNYYFYEDSPGHFTIVPWDVESTFWINPNHATPHWTEVPDDCDLTYPYWGGLARAPGCDRVIRALGTDLGPFRAAARELLDGPFSEETMIDAVDRYEAFIEAEAMAEETPTMYGTFKGAVSELRRTIPRLRDRLEGLIEETDVAE